MDRFHSLPWYKKVLRHLAGKYRLLTESTEKFSEEESFNLLVSDIKDYLDRSNNLDALDFMLKVREFICGIAEAYRRGISQLNRSSRKLVEIEYFSANELFIFGEMLLHQKLGMPSWVMSGKFLQQTSATRIDESVTGNVLKEGALNSLWVEFSIPIEKTFKPWIWRTKGLLITRNLFFDLPQADRQNVAAKMQQIKSLPDVQALFAQLCIEEKPCIGYNVTVIQEDSAGLRFVPITFGYLADEPVTEMLQCYEESSTKDRRRTMDTEQVWANTAVRLLLSFHLGNFTTRQPTIVQTGDHIPKMGGGTALFKKIPIIGAANNTGLILEKQTKIPQKPFRLTKDH